MPNPIPLGYNAVLENLIAWGQSGLINSTVIKSYMPPIKDPQTGIEVLMPATTFKAVGVENSRQMIEKLQALPRYETDVPSNNQIKLTNSWGEDLPTINSLPNAPYAGSGVNDFNVNHDDPAGPQTFIGYRTMPAGTLISQTLNATAAMSTQTAYVDSITTDSSKNQILAGLPPTATGTKKTDQPLARYTTSDRLARELNRGLPRIIDRAEDAATVFAIPTVDAGPELEDPDQLPARNQAFIPGRYELRATGVPCAVPGVLNCIMTKYDSVDTSDLRYTYVNPKVGMYYVSDRDIQQADSTYADDGDSIRIQPIDPGAFDNPSLSIVESEPGDLFVGDVVYGR